jgi:hypothetical protein
MTWLGRLFRRRKRELDQVRASVVAIEADGSAWASVWPWPASRYAKALVPIRRRTVRKLGLVHGVLVDCGIDPDTLRPRRVRRMFSDVDHRL